jgi:hypothetical protein
LAHLPAKSDNDAVKPRSRRLHLASGPPATPSTVSRAQPQIPDHRQRDRPYPRTAQHRSSSPRRRDRPQRWPGVPLTRLQPPPRESALIEVHGPSQSLCCSPASSAGLRPGQPDDDASSTCGAVVAQVGQYHQAAASVRHPSTPRSRWRPRAPKQRRAALKELSVIRPVEIELARQVEEAWTRIMRGTRPYNDHGQQGSAS